MSSGGPESRRPPRRAPLRLRSLRWRLSFAYLGLLAVILMGLGVIVLVTVSQLLTASAFQRFQQEALAAASIRRALYESATIRRDANGQCATPFTVAFQNEISDPLTQAPADMQQVLLLDPATGQVLAPDALAGQMPTALRLTDLAQVTQRAKNRPAAWHTLNLGTAVTYRVTQQGVPIGVGLIAYDYRIVTNCTKTPVTYVAGDAVLMVTQSFTGVQNTLNSFKVDLLLSVGILFVLGLVIGLAVTNAPLRRLSRVSAAAEQLAAGDLHRRVGLPPQDDEVGELAQTFDEMAQRLEEAFVAQQQSEERVRQFLTDASHELRTPLTSVRGYLDVLARTAGNADAETQRILGVARTEAERMTRLVEDLLTLARFDMGRPIELAPTDVIALVGEAVDQARLVAGQRSVTMQGDGQGRLMVALDRDRIKQVLLVLLDNALKYGRQDDQGWVLVTLSRTRDTAMLHIRDNGPGIATDDLPYLFDRFYRGKHAGGAPPKSGSGLGLAIARAIVVAHGGTITVASELGQGALFTIVLPIA
jgi:two-component system OmpR family sensor kinase